MLLLQLLRLGTGPAWRPIEIHLEAAKPPHAELIEELAERRVVWQQPSNAIAFPAALLAAPIARPAHVAPSVRGALVPAADFADSARQLVDALLDLGIVDLPAAAESIHMSERSLQRRLTASGLSFTQLVEEARFARARRLLLDCGVKIVEISAELGYSDSANFTRAFRRWSGVSPQAFRKTG
jgi:AraC-like DNA-binding protein